MIISRLACLAWWFSVCGMPLVPHATVAGAKSVRRQPIFGSSGSRFYSAVCVSLATPSFRVCVCVWGGVCVYRVEGIKILIRLLPTGAR